MLIKSFSSYLQSNSNSININNHEISSQEVQKRYNFRSVRALNNELPDLLQWDTIEKLPNEVIIKFIIKLLKDLSESNDYSALETLPLPTKKIFVNSLNDSKSLEEAITSLFDNKVNVRNLTFFMALIYMDKISNKVLLLYFSF